MLALGRCFDRKELEERYRRFVCLCAVVTWKHYVGVE